MTDSTQFISGRTLRDAEIMFKLDTVVINIDEIYVPAKRRGTLDEAVEDYAAGRRMTVRFLLAGCASHIAMGWWNSMRLVAITARR